jgi:hypothetical protein
LFLPVVVVSMYLLQFSFVSKKKNLGIDKKTSVMDYVVKNLYEKNEEELLDVLDDLNLIIQADSSSSGTMNSYQINSDNVHSGSTNSSVPHQFASIEIFQEYNALNKNFQSLTKELERNLQNHQNPDNQREDPLAMALEINNNNSDRIKSSTSSNQPTPFLSPSKTLFASPTAKQIFNEYLTNLENYIFNYREKINILMKKKLLLMKKIQQLIEYFGEEKTNYLVKVTENNNNNNNNSNSNNNNHSSTAGGLKSGILSHNNSSNSTAAAQSLYDVSSIFLALKNFCRSLAFSKEQYEWKISRNQK